MSKVTKRFLLNTKYESDVLELRTRETHVAVFVRELTARWGKSCATLGYGMKGAEICFCPLLPCLSACCALLRK